VFSVRKIRRSEIRKEERENRQRTEGGRLKTDGRRKTAALGRGTMDEGPEVGSQKSEDRRKTTENGRLRTDGRRKTAALGRGTTDDR
jgi:hypothetical protein